MKAMQHRHSHACNLSFLMQRATQGNRNYSTTGRKLKLIKNDKKKKSEARERGLLINENMTKYMEVTRTVVNGNHLQCGKYEFEHVKELSYLGSQLNQTNSANCEIQARIISGN